MPVLLSAVAGHAVSGGCDGRRGGLLLPPFPRGFCVGGQKEGGGGGGGAEEEHGGEGAVARCAACSPDAGAEVQDRRDLRRVSGLSLPPAGEKEEEEEEEESLPRCTFPRQSCRRLCDHQRQDPTVSQTLGIPVVMQRQVSKVHSFMLPVQFLVTVLDMSVVWYFDRCLV